VAKLSIEFLIQLIESNLFSLWIAALPLPSNIAVWVEERTVILYEGWNNFELHCVRESNDNYLTIASDLGFWVGLS